MSCSRDDILINLEHRIFYLSGDICNETVGKVCFNILYLLQEDDRKEASEVGFGWITYSRQTRNSSLSALKSHRHSWMKTKPRNRIGICTLMKR